MFLKVKGNQEEAFWFILGGNRTIVPTGKRILKTREKDIVGCAQGLPWLAGQNPWALISVLPLI